MFKANHNGESTGYDVVDKSHKGDNEKTQARMQLGCRIMHAIANLQATTATTFLFFSLLWIWPVDMYSAQHK